MNPLLSPIGKVLFLDLATYKKTRGSVAKVKIQIDLTKQRPHHIWMGFDEDENGEGRWQPIQYERVPDYCGYCKHQGHISSICTVKRRDEENKRRKEKEEAEKIKKSGNEKNKEGQQQDNENGDQYAKSHNKEDDKDKDQEEWQTQKKKGKKDSQQQQQQVQHHKDMGKDHQVTNAKTPKSPKKVDQQDHMQKQSGSTSNSKYTNAESQDCNVDTGVQCQHPQPQIDNNNVINPLPQSPIKQVNNEHTKKQVKQTECSQKENQVDQAGGRNVIMEANDNNVLTTRTSGIDSTLPHPSTPFNNLNVLAVDVVAGGEDGGMKENTTNLQEGVTRGRDALLVDHRNDYRAPATKKNAIASPDLHVQDNQSKFMSQDGVSDFRDHNNGNDTDLITGNLNKDKVHIDEVDGLPTEDPNINPIRKSNKQKESEVTQGQKYNQRGQNASSQLMNNKSTLALSKKKRDSLKKKQNIEEQQNSENLQQRVNYTIVKEQAGIHVTPLQVQTSSRDVCVKKKGLFQMNFMMNIGWTTLKMKLTLTNLRNYRMRMRKLVLIL